jgi:HEAT repeat protein
LHVYHVHRVIQLISQLTDPNEGIREHAADGLGRVEYPSDISELLGAGDSRAVGSLIGALKDKDSRVRHVAAFALWGAKDPRVVDPLIAALKDKDTHVRSAAAVSLSKIKDPRAVDPLIAYLKDGDSLSRITVVTTWPNSKTLKWSSS